MQLQGHLSRAIYFEGTRKKTDIKVTLHDSDRFCLYVCLGEMKEKR